ncbi:hypothetical protein GJ699_10190 [Duganella sp. FT80W]|uniref:DUF4124 domain-containing protein n=1 Tax=Duganella guangzhouensis TaxID=2666084 RepID=A0A6I2KW72_9BURK|nr:hypothetical protein [Duganella guangzhouensis]MRW90355.1 hypothetical protein [Duganella guangzhouensis]
MKAHLIYVAAMLMPLLAQAQSSEAARYVNRQGVEIIQNRVTETPPASASKPAITEAAAPRATAERPAAVHDARFQISSREQNERDRDRLVILRQELQTEIENYQAKNKILHSPSLQASLSEEQLQRVRDITHAHEQNIRDLNNEISRALRDTSKN